MGYEIEQQDGFFEVRLFGQTSKFEILMALATLMRRDPGKKHPDVWVFGAEVHIPFAHFGGISEAVGFAFTRPPVARKTAFVAADAFQFAQLELYRLEASALPLDIRVFRSYDEAVDWVTRPESPVS